jgi:predicted Zn-ribbon and HTH transcriptional regulator
MQTEAFVANCVWKKSFVMMTGVGLRPLACRDCGFESRRGMDVCLLKSVVWCQVQFSAMG